MAILKAYGREIRSVFQLLGDKENDITSSICWALVKCPLFLKEVVKKVCGLDANPEDVTVLNQQYDAVTGITDIEVTDDKTFYIIFEAKRGWLLPGAEQLTKYSTRTDFVAKPVAHKHIVSLSECSQTYANLYLPFHEVNGIPVSHLSLSEVYQMAKEARSASNHEQKHLLDEFTEYLGGVMTMQNKTSNWVYVVALSHGYYEGCELSWIDIVKKHNKYFCPVGGNGWPKEPPNYIAFRYDGKLQAIHHIEGYTVTRNIHELIPEMPDEEWSENHFVYSLGPAIVPKKTVKTGNIYRSGRVWAMLDTLMTCDTISEARDISYAR